MIKTELKFGLPEGIAAAMENIAYGRGFGKEMGRGLRALSQKYGGEDFAIQVKGMEMAAYDSRGAYGVGLNYAVANRGACSSKAVRTIPSPGSCRWKRCGKAISHKVL